MAPRLPPRLWHRPARGAWLAAGLWLGLAGLAQACDQSPDTAMPESLSAPWPGDGATLAWYDGPTTRYAHGVLGDAIEGTELHFRDAAAPCAAISVTLPNDLVFEDTAPRLVDLDADGRPEIIVVQSHRRLGAQLAIYAVSRDGARLSQVAQTRFIGRTNRWLAPIGAADLDGDGAVEIAYIDRPHLARTLRVWRFVAGASGQGTLTEVAAVPGLTNHRIGDPTIPGGLRDCGAGPEMITANADWSRVMSTRLMPDNTLVQRDIGRWTDGALDAALSCPN